MSYATLAEYKERLTGFVNLYEDSGVFDDVLALRDIEDAQAEVDASAAVRFAVPVTASAALPLLRNWTLTLAEELAWSRGGKDALPANVKDRAENVRKQLIRLAEGSLALCNAVEKSLSSGGASEICVDTPQMTRAKLAGW